MRHVDVISLSCALMVGFAGAASAQVPPPASPPPSDGVASVALSADQTREVATWLSAMEKWQRYDAHWRNRPVHDGWGRIASRQPPPAAPEWLERYCASAMAAGIVLIDAHTTACRLLADPRAQIRSLPSAVHAAEKPRFSSFMSRMHLDVLSTTTSNGARLYGIVGSHISLVDVGRVQVFGPPGVLLLSVPDDDGGRRVALGYTWGISVRLIDLRLGAPAKNLTLFLNITKVWVDTGTGGGANTRGFDIVGLSLAPRKTR